MLRAAILFVVAFALAAGCLTSSDLERTAFDPPKSDDDAVRSLAKDVLEATERCDVDRIEEIVHPDNLQAVREESPQDDGSSAAFIIRAVLNCEIEVDYKDSKVGHAAYEPFLNYDALAVLVETKAKMEISTNEDWRDCSRTLYFAETSEGLRLVSNWLVLC